MFCHSIGDSNMEMGNIRANSNGRGDVANIIWDKSIQLRVSGTEKFIFLCGENKGGGKESSWEAQVEGSKIKISPVNFLSFNIKGKGLQSCQIEVNSKINP